MTLELRGADPQRAKIADIAASWGFTDASSFSRRFRNRFGVAPSDVFGTTRDQREEAAIIADWAGAGLNRNYTEWLAQASGHEA